ncbi:MAG: sigma 54-interacting transcriptional regulator [Candidatus Magnetomorum sp.]|nr:sigma 54-interacting transcriptional regulator [Candidatus Magnetomorum sp.]
MPRFLSATNKNPSQMVSDDLMREDFFYRLNVLSLEIPPLRKRKQDIPLLINEFIEKNRSKRMPVRNIPDYIIEQMKAYKWPGNVRELFNELRKFFYTGKMINIDYLFRKFC